MGAVPPLSPLGKTACAILMSEHAASHPILLSCVAFYGADVEKRLVARRASPWEDTNVQTSRAGDRGRFVADCSRFGPATAAGLWTADHIRGGEKSYGRRRGRSGKEQ